MTERHHEDHSRTLTFDKNSMCCGKRVTTETFGRDTPLFQYILIVEGTFLNDKSYNSKNS